MKHVLEGTLLVSLRLESSTSWHRGRLPVSAHARQHPHLAKEGLYSQDCGTVLRESSSALIHPCSF